METGKLLRLSSMMLVILVQIGFAQWTHVTGPTGSVMYLSTYESTALAQSDSGFFFSTDYGLNWIEANAELANSLVGTFPTDTVNYLLNNYLSQLPPLPDTLKRLQIANLDLSSLSSLITSLSILYPETYLDSILVSLDTGKTALRISEIMSQLALYAAGIDTNEILSRIDSAQIWFSTEGSSEWMTAEEILSGIELRAVMKTDQYAFAGTNRGIFRAAIDGNDWGQMNTGLADTNVYALMRINTLLFAGTGNGVFVSTNDGSTWSAVNTGLTNKKVHALAVSGNNLFAGTQGGGVFISMNHGSSWRAVNTGLTSMNVNALAVSGTTLLAGTSGAGLWIRPVSEMTPVRESPVQIPATFSLAQNYPNPFNPATAISYKVSALSNVTLRVYDILGRDVATLVNEVQKAGTYEVRFDGSRMPSGVYFYRLQAGRFTDTKKLILMK